MPYGTDYGVECLLGNMKESNNKKTQHHFSMMEGEELARLSYGEVTRWLIHLNAYDNLPELYTMQSRRIMLKRNEDGHLIGFRAMGGDFLPFRDKSNEPMTIWKWKKEDKKAEPQFSPQIHNPAVHAWREFPKRIPGVVQWIQALQKTSLISTDCLITFRMIGMVYGDQMSYTYGECIEDTLTMSINLLMDLNKVWRSRITEQVEKCQSVASEAMDRAAYQLCKSVLFFYKRPISGMACGNKTGI